MLFGARDEIPALSLVLQHDFFIFDFHIYSRIKFLFELYFIEKCSSISYMHLAVVVAGYRVDQDSFLFLVCEKLSCKQDF